jgi:metallo-beta-lactamase family protein
VKITSFGGAGEVTGSKHLVEINGSRVLLDCGMFQGHRQDADTKNRRLHVDPARIHAVVLSHAHIDHSGLLPMLIKHGYRGSIVATPATRDLCSIMLMDSAHIQQKDAEWLTKKQMTFIPPLYRQEDVQETMRRFISVPYELPYAVAPGVTLTFHDAGHVLGSAMVELNYEEAGTARRFIFSGDIGRKNLSILQDPWEPTEADVVMMEGTYGDRDHDPVTQMDEKLARYINETAARGGKVIVPSFALERAQEIIFAIKRLQIAKAIPEIPVIVDSPMTVNVTEVFRLHTESFDEEFREVKDEAGDPFQPRNIRYIRASEESIALNAMKEPAVIISAAGMCEHGRILHHLRNNCADPKNTILIVGFQAANTLGRKIVERQRTIRIFGVDRELNAQVHVMNEFSAHAGREELIGFAARFTDRLERVLLVHGENGALGALRDALEAKGRKGVHIMQPGETLDV